MLVAASSYKDKVAGTSNVSLFKDVPYTHWAAGYIETYGAAGVAAPVIWTAATSRIRQ